MHCRPIPPVPASATRASHGGMRDSRSRAATLLAVGSAALLAACAGPARVRTPPAGAPSTALTVGATATVEGRVGSVDTAPWAYDGNAVVKLASDVHGPVELQFPARWNLCRAGDIGELQALSSGMRVRATGSVSAPATLTVCAEPSHGLQRLD